MSGDHDKLLVTVLQEEIASLENELESMRESFRYQAGRLLVEGLTSPGRRSVPALVALMRLVRQKRRKTRGGVSVAPALEMESAADVLVFGTGIPPGHRLGKRVRAEADPARLAAMIERAARPSTLVLRHASARVLRHLEAWRLQGWQVIWWPELVEIENTSLLEYARRHCDRVVDEARE